MPDPATTGISALAITSSGLAIYGLQTGMHPEFLVAGCVGAFWSLSLYSEPQPAVRRVSVTAISALVAAYLTPVAVALLQIKDWLPGELSQEIAQMPIALLIGLLAHRKIGPAILRASDTNHRTPNTP